MKAIFSKFTKKYWIYFLKNEFFKEYYIMLKLNRAIKHRLASLKERKALTAGIGYTVGNLLLKGIAFFSIPIFTRLLTPADFGLYSVFVSYESILFLFVGLCLHSSIKAANIEFSGKIEEYVSSIFVLVFLTSFFVYFLSIIFRNQISAVTGFPSIIILLMMSQAVSSAVMAIYNNKISLSYDYKMYLSISAFSAVGNVVFSITLILTAFKDVPYLGRIVGTVLPACIVLVYIIFNQFKKSRATVKKNYWKFGFLYSLPIIPHGFSQVILSQFNRIMIQNMVGNVETGLFSFAFTIAMIPQVIATSLDTAWGPWFFERYKNKEFSTISHRANQYVVCFSILIVAISAVSPEMIRIMAPEVYWGSVKIVVPAILGVYFIFLYYLPASIEYYEKKTVYIAVGTVLSGVINIVITYYVIKEFNYIYSAHATLVAYAINFIFHCFIAKKIADTLPYNMNKIFMFIILTLLASIVINSIMYSLILRIIIFIVFLSMILALEIFVMKNKV